ncbi:MAG: TrmB family transcriptional regulator, partial [Candidatus Woesearchaeota archaeon]
MEEELMDIGLSKNEAKIYIALNELGNSTIGDIAKKSKIHRSNVYDAIEGLVQKGLASSVIIDKVKHYQSTDSTNLFNMILEKQEKVKEILPRIALMQGLSKNRSEVFIQEGLPALRRSMDGILDTAYQQHTDILVWGAPSTVGKLIGPFLSNFHTRRIEKKVVMKHIYNTDAYDRIKFLKPLKYTEVKILPSEYNTPV